MATKKTYGSSRAFTEGHLEVIGDQSEVTNPSPVDTISAKTKAVYATQRAHNAQPWSVRKGNDIHARDPNPSFKDRLAHWELQVANKPPNEIHFNAGPKPVDLGRDAGGNWYKPYQAGSRGPRGNMPQDRINQGRWSDGRDGSPLSRRDQLLYDRKQSGELTRRQKEDQKIGQYAANQPLAKNELKDGIQGNFGSLGNFFNKDD
tara:strand:+ start:614 stop:1225 length:612 start_codon:yes stop_codon:yes gene_type:complete